MHSRVSTNIATSPQFRACLQGQGSPEEDKWPQSEPNDDDGTELDNGLGHGNQTSEIHEQFRHNVRPAEANDLQHSGGNPRQTSKANEAQDANHSGVIGEAVESIDAKRCKIKWPKASEKKLYSDFETKVIGSIKSSGKKCTTIDDELTILSDAIYQTGENMFGAVSNRRCVQRNGPSRSNRKLTTLRKEKRRLRREWETADANLKEQLKEERKEVMRKIRDEARKERRRSRKKEKKRSKQQFFKNPYKFAKNLFDEARSGVLDCSQEELENSLRSTYNDPLRDTPLDHMSGIPRPTRPGILFQLGELTLIEMKSFI